MFFFLTLIGGLSLLSDRDDTLLPKGEVILPPIRYEMLACTLKKAVDVASKAANSEGRAQSVEVKRLRKIWKKAKELGFPVQDDEITLLDEAIAWLDLRKRSPTMSLREEIAPMLMQLYMRAHWAEVVLKEVS
jgi:aspartyl/asparaginyl-tRNA synthetase